MKFLLLYVLPFLLVFFGSTLISYIEYKRNKLDYNTLKESSSSVLIALLYFMIIQAFFMKSFF